MMHCGQHLRGVVAWPGVVLAGPLPKCGVCTALASTCPTVTGTANAARLAFPPPRAGIVQSKKKINCNIIVSSENLLLNEDMAEERKI